MLFGSSQRMENDTEFQQQVKAAEARNKQVSQSFDQEQPNKHFEIDPNNEFPVADSMEAQPPLAPQVDSGKSKKSY